MRNYASFRGNWPVVPDGFESLRSLHLFQHKSSCACTKTLAGCRHTFVPKGTRHTFVPRQTSQRPAFFVQIPAALSVTIRFWDLDRNSSATARRRSCSSLGLRSDPGDFTSDRSLRLLGQICCSRHSRTVFLRSCFSACSRFCLRPDAAFW